MEAKSRGLISLPVSFFVSKRDRDSVEPMCLISFLISLQSRSFRDMSRGVRLSCARLSSRQIYIVYQSEPINRVSLAMYRLKAHRSSFSGRRSTRSQTSNHPFSKPQELPQGRSNPKPNQPRNSSGLVRKFIFPPPQYQNRARPLSPASTPISDPSKVS